MATQPIDDTNLDDELILTDDQEIAEGGEAEAALAAEADTIIETFDEEAADLKEETPLIKMLRQRDRENTRRIKDLEKQVQPRVERTKKPDLWEDCEGDPDKFEAELFKWQQNEAAIAEAERAANAEREQHNKAWIDERDAYRAAAAKLGREDFDASESAVIATLDDAQQATIIMAAKHPEKFVYALGKSPKRLAELAKITNPIKLAAEVARIEGERTVARKEPIAPDTPLRGTARIAAVTEDKVAADLLKKGQQSGDMTEYSKHMREKRRAANAV